METRKTGSTEAQNTGQTSLKALKRNPNQRQALLESIFEGISDPLILMDQTMKIKMINSAARRYYNLSPGSAINDQYCYKIYKNTEYPCDGCKLVSPLENQEYVCFERNNPHDPEKIEQVTNYPVANLQDQGQLSLVRIQDITKLRTIEKELEKADKLMAMGTLVSSIAHETNNPNNFIMMNIQLLMDSWNSMLPILDQYQNQHGDFSMGGLPYSEMKNELPGMLRGIENSSKRIRQIIKGLKDYTRNDETRMNDAVDVNEMIQSAVELSRTTIEKYSNTFEFNEGQHLPIIVGNRQSLEQVMINLIQNACHASSDSKKPITISTGMNATSDHIMIKIEDHGSGISDDMMDQIMKPFFSTRKDKGGTGLGLSISSNIIKAHGGNIKVDSSPGNGSLFTIHLPIINRTKKINILIVDDDPGSRSILKTVLERNTHYALMEASDGAEALLEIGQKVPDVLISDIHMPGMDGADICRLVKNREELSTMKVIMTTGFINSAQTREITELGFNHILEKPIDKHQIIKTIEDVLGDHP